MRQPIALPFIAALLCGAWAPFAAAEILVASDQNFKTVFLKLAPDPADQFIDGRAALHSSSPKEPA